MLAAFHDAEAGRARAQQQHHDVLVHDGAALPSSETNIARLPVLGAYELCLKCSHLFNLLDARGAISVTERVALMARIRTLVVGVARAYAAQHSS